MHSESDQFRKIRQQTADSRISRAAALIVELDKSCMSGEGDYTYSDEEIETRQKTLGEFITWLSPEEELAAYSLADKLIAREE